MTKRILFTFNKNGTIETDAEGFQGVGCMETTKRLMDAIMARVIDTKQKQEYYVNEAEVSSSN